MNSFKSILIAAICFLSSALNAQISVNVNIGSPPQWGPIGYSEARYYYLPDIEAYYDIQSSMFIYYGDGVWLHRAYLPVRYASYDLYYGYKVVITNYQGNAPYIHYKEHKGKYKKGYRGPSQKTIGQKPGKGNSNPKVPQIKYPNRKNRKSNGNINNKSNTPNNNQNNQNSKSNNNKSNNKNGGRKK
ncbi:MAG: hypothetical protein A3K10_06480 [Bacteroidetes bacterium RIFCSPLOWO2_12_FULL_31_6]|nr:MAG: hypothetical protein A3K10_06480 [Bacteroidetes bacterium RIFCSPLOWO2_12_FULL_31_6]